MTPGGPWPNDPYLGGPLYGSSVSVGGASPAPVKSLVSNRVRGMLTNAASTPTLTVDGALASSVRLAMDAANAPWRFENSPRFGGDGRGYAGAFEGANVATQASQPTWRIAFDFDGQKFRVGYLSLGGQIRIWINEQPSAWTTVVNDTAAHALLVDMGTRAYRRIVVEIDSGAGIFGGVWFAGIDRLPADTVWPPSITTGFSLAVIGDSYCAGNGATRASTGYVQTLARLLGTQNSYGLGVSGAGFVSVGGTTLGNYDNPLRVGDLAAINADVIVAQGSINDTGGNGTIGPAVTRWVGAVRAILPNAQLLITGDLSPRTAIAGDISINADLKAAAAANSVPFIDPEAGIPWFNGTGNVGAPVGDGNADFYMSSAVPLHPSQLGHDAIGTRLSREIGTLIGAST